MKTAEQTAIAVVNNVTILSTYDAKRLIPIKPICEALGIAFNSQIDKIKADEDLSSVMMLSITTGADGKSYEMACLPLEFIFGWLFTINPKNVKPESQEIVRKYRMECYSILYRFFTDPQTFLKEKKDVMEIQTAEYNQCQKQFKEYQKKMNEAKQRLNDTMKITIEDWRENNRQLNLNFSEAQ